MASQAMPNSSGNEGRRVSGVGGKGGKARGLRAKKGVDARGGVAGQVKTIGLWGFG